MQELLEALAFQPSSSPVRRAFLAAEVLHLIHCLQLDFGVSHRSGRSAPGQSAVRFDHWGGTTGMGSMGSMGSDLSQTHRGFKEVEGLSHSEWPAHKGLIIINADAFPHLCGI